MLHICAKTDRGSSIFAPLGSILLNIICSKTCKLRNGMFLVLWIALFSRLAHLLILVSRLIRGQLASDKAQSVYDLAYHDQAKSLAEDPFERLEEITGRQLLEHLSIREWTRRERHVLHRHRNEG